MDMRISGLASGMDVDNIVKQMMQAERIPRDRLFQQRQVMEWRMDAYRDVNSKMLSFRNSTFDLQLDTSFNSKSVSVSETSGINVTANSNANDGSHSIQVKHLARGASIISDEAIGAEAGAATKLKDLNPSLTGVIQLTITGENGESDEPITINVNSENTLAEFVSKVNAESGTTGVRANYDSNLDRLFFSSTETGVDANFELKTGNPVNDNLLKEVFNLPVLDSNSNENEGGKGQNATVIYNGATLNFASNNFTINGMNFEVTRKTTDPVSITVQQDTTAVFDRIKDFVDQYNELIEHVNGKLDEPTYRDFQPLTNEQKDEMTEKEIERWEEQAMSGLLRRDTTLSAALTEFRREISAVAEGLPEGALNSLAQIGIETGPWQEKGKLHINESELRKAIAEKPDEVQALFTNKEVGLGSRLTDSLDRAMNQVRETAGAQGSANHSHFIGRRMEQLNESISRFDDRLTQLETRYYSEFTAMERYINQMNQQSMFLAQQFGGM